MSHSTTATSSYPLAKYSKSYSNIQQPSGIVPEWQHFTNPSIRLVLDVKKGARLESVRLRIIWSMDSDSDPGQREVEDVDLLTLSCLQQPAQKRQAEGLPLKAVYRDTVVGIRYLHPIEYKDVPVYRRFQITFFSSVSVLEFIKTISSVCPCKASPTGDPAARTMNPPPYALRQQPQASLTHAPTMFSQMAPSVLTTASQHFPSSQAPFSSSSDLLTSNVNIPPPLHAETGNVHVPSSSAPLPLVQNPPTDAPDNFLGPQIQPSREPANDRVQELQHDISLPSSSSPTSTTTGINNSKGSRGSDDITEHPPAFLASVRESTRLYDLPRAQLEQLVGDVVREEGFAKLMENLNSMWGVKSFVGI